MIRLFNTTQAAEYLTLQPCTLESWRYKGIGPSWLRVGRSVRYDLADLDRWIEKQKGAA